MAEMLDQIFVILKHWLVGHSPVWLQPVVASLLSVVAIIVVFATLFAVTTIMERKGLGRFQNRYGPNRVGPVWVASANRGRYQVAHQGRHRS